MTFEFYGPNSKHIETPNIDKDHTWWMLVGTFDAGGDGVSFGDSPILWGDSPLIKFLPA